MFYLRDAAYALQSELALPSDQPPFDVVLTPASATLTRGPKNKNHGSSWDTRTRKSKAVHWHTLDLTTIPDPPVVLLANDRFASPIGTPAVRLVGTSSSKAHEETTRISIGLPVIEPHSPSSTGDNDLDTAQEKPQRKAACTQKSVVEGDSEVVLSQNAYIPPHLRNSAKITRVVPGNGATVEKAANGTSEIAAQPAASKVGEVPTLFNGPLDNPTKPPSAPSTASNQASQKANRLDGGERVDSPRTEGKTGYSKHAEITDYPSGNPPAPPQSAPRREKRQWPCGPKPQPRKTAWPKRRDMKAASNEDVSDGAIPRRFDGNGDPGYDVKKLMDWNGDWLPPPEQWLARKGLLNQDLGQSIELWMENHDDDCTKDIELGPGLNEGEHKELVPRYWIYTRIEHDSLEDFWRQFPGRAPASVGDLDVEAESPFWDRYVDSTSRYLNPLAVPDARVDDADPQNHMIGFDCLISIDEKLRLMKEIRAKSRAAAMAKRKRPLRETAPVQLPLEDRRISPKSNIYLRPVQPVDVKQIAEIYNHYVETTIYAPEFDKRSDAIIRNRINDDIEAGLPYLVAVARANRPRGQQGFVSEKIVGFASLTEWHSQGSIYRHTFGLEIYVHPGYTSQNIASCLLDKLLDMVNTGYAAREGYEYRNDFEYLKMGPGRYVKTIILEVFKQHCEQPDDTSKFLEQFGFHCAGHIPHMGFKLGMDIDMYMYRHTTTEVIDPNARPAIAS